MKEEQIKQYYGRIEKLLNGANKETYGFVPEEIRQILINYEILQQENQQLKDILHKINVSGIEDENTNVLDIYKENKQLKEDYNKAVHEATAFESKVYELEEDIKGLQQERTNLINSIPFKENKHYKHIIDELEKWLEERIDMCFTTIPDYEIYIARQEEKHILQEVLNKLQELKGSDK